MNDFKRAASRAVREIAQENAERPQNMATTNASTQTEAQKEREGLKGDASAAFATRGDLDAATKKINGLSKRSRASKK